MNKKELHKSILEKIESKDFVVGIFGLGYVGVPLSLRFNQVGFKVIGFDIDEYKVKAINKGKTFFRHIDESIVQEAVSKGFMATSDFSNVSKCDALIICVPTPLNKYKEPDLSYVTQTVDNFVPYLREGQIVSLESTTYPGTSEEEILPRLESTGMKVGRDLYLVYSPEREDPGNEGFNTNTIPKIVGGHTEDCLAIGSLLYSKAIDTVIPVSSTKVAEMTKLLENIHRAVNIGLVNEMKVVADKMNIDIFEVINAAATKPFGFTPYYPGPGLGGHCIPIDPFYLTWKAKEYNLHTRFIELSGEVNESMPKYVFDKINSGLNVNGKSLSSSKVLILGLAYKKNIEDMRESPSITIMEYLRSSDCKVDYSDPYIPEFPKMKHHHFDLNSIELTQKNIASYDAVVLATDHDSFDYDFILKHTRLLIDCRGKFDPNLSNVIKA